MYEICLLFRLFKLFNSNQLKLCLSQPIRNNTGM